MAAFIVLLVIVIVVAVSAEIILHQPGQSHKTTFEWEKGILPFFEAVEEIKEFGGKLLEKRPPPDLSEPFRTWAAQRLGPEDEVLKNWLTSMSGTGLKALTGQLANFCAELNLELAWLVRDQLELAPQLKQTMREVVVAYCGGCWKAVQIQPEIEIFRTFVAVTEAPLSEAHQAVSQKLLTELSEHNLAPTPDPNWFLASEKRRAEYLGQIIRQASETDRTKFYTIFREIISVTPNGSSNGNISETPAPTSKQAQSQG